MLVMGNALPGPAMDLGETPVYLVGSTVQAVPETLTEDSQFEQAPCVATQNLFLFVRRQLQKADLEQFHPSIH